MKTKRLTTAAIAFVGTMWLALYISMAQAAPCLIVTLTGTQGGRQSFNGLAGAGKLLRYGDDSNECGAVKLQFDAGRGTTMRLSQLGVGPEQLNAGLRDCRLGVMDRPPPRHSREDNWWAARHGRMYEHHPSSLRSFGGPFEDTVCKTDIG